MQVFEVHQVGQLLKHQVRFWLQLTYWPDMHCSAVCLSNHIMWLQGCALMQRRQLP